MGKNSIGLAQTKLTGFDRQELGAIHTIGSIEEGDGGGVIAGVDSDNAHSASSV